MTSCLICLDSAAFLILNEQQIYMFGKIQSSQAGGQLYIDTYFLQTKLVFSAMNVDVFLKMGQKRPLICLFSFSFTWQIYYKFVQ